MEIYYDNDVDALYIQLSLEEPDGVIEIAEGFHLDTTADGRIAGFEILNASRKLNLQTILSYSLEFEPQLLMRAGVGAIA